MAGEPVYWKVKGPQRYQEDAGRGYRYDKDRMTTNPALAQSASIGYLGKKKHKVWPFSWQARQSVICSELYRQGDMSGTIWEADEDFGAKQSPQLMAGYHLWAKPLVGLMQKSHLVYRIVKAPALRWANYMAYKQGVSKKNDYAGAAVFFIGAPLCIVLGSIVLAVKPDKVHEYNG